MSAAGKVQVVSRMSNSRTALQNRRLSLHWQRPGGGRVPKEIVAAPDGTRVNADGAAQHPGTIPGDRMLAMRKLPVVPICRNPSALPLPPNRRQIPRRPASQRGGSRSSRTRGGMRWTLLARKDEACLRRTAKSCGPDAPTLESSWWRQLRQRGWQTSPVTRESTKETVKTIARGMPGVPV
jgi:hypothetical protein